MMILISGASGFIGLELSRVLIARGYRVFGLTRNVKKAQSQYSNIEWIEWDPDKKIGSIPDDIKIDIVINLVGENIAQKRWSGEQKKKIYSSRVDATHFLAKMLRDSKQSVKVFISSSGVGVYGDRKNETVHEKSIIASSYIGKLCEDWENAVFNNKDIYQRANILRIGPVLGKEGMLKQLIPLFKLGLGAKLGNGEQYMSWIHIDDLVRIFLYLIDEKVEDKILNATAPYPVKNKDFTQELSRSLNRFSFLGAPKWLLRLSVGEFAEHILEGAKVLPENLLTHGFRFKYPTIKRALKDILSKADRKD